MNDRLARHLGAALLRRLAAISNVSRPSGWHLVAASTLIVARVLPRQLRMPFLVQVSRRIDRWFFKEATWIGDLDTHRERTLHWLLRKATDDGIVFDLAVQHDGIEHLENALARGGGILLIGVHSMLLHLSGRYVHDLSIRSEFVGYDLDAKIYGTRYQPAYLRTDGRILLRIKNLLTQGYAVFVMIDPLVEGKRTMPFQYGNKTILLSGASIDVALAAGASVVFANALIHRSKPVLFWGASATDNELNSRQVLTDYSEFLSQSLERRLQ